jgi:S-formylglutathione hydrolase FrmB
MTPPLLASTSLIHGWLPIAAQVLTAAVTITAVGWRPGHWALRWLGVAVVAGVGAALLVRWYIGYQGWSDHAAPWAFWLWIALTAATVVVLLAGWRRAGRWQRASAALAVVLCLLCVALMLNIWTGYVPTTSSAWARLRGIPIGGQIDAETFRELRERGETPPSGTIVTVDVPDDASGFKHREELVYLPPRWYATNPPPALPVVMMIGGEFGTPKDWPSVGIQQVLDDFSAAHGGNAPVVVFVDHSGAFANDTECVNGVRGNAADHLTKDVIPYLRSNFGVQPDAAHWGIAGWSAGGTCALTLTVKHPDLFSAFVDIDGQLGPSAGTEKQTLQRLYGGDPVAKAAFDPKSVMAEHGSYKGVAGWFAVSESTTAVYHPGGGPAPANPPPSSPIGTADAAQYMCSLASSYGIECAVVPQPGRHGFPNAVDVFKSALPWLAGRIGTPDVPVIPLPGAPS